MYTQSVRKIFVILSLVALLLAPAVPAWAEAPHPAGLLGWVDGWFQSFTSWFSGAKTQTVDSVEQEGAETLETPQSLGDSPDTVEPLNSTNSNDEGPAVDPLG